MNQLELAGFTHAAIKALREKSKDHIEEHQAIGNRIAGLPQESIVCIVLSAMHERLENIEEHLGLFQPKQR